MKILNKPTIILNIKIKKQKIIMIFKKRINNIYVRSYLKNERKRWATTKGTNQLLKYS